MSNTCIKQKITANQSIYQLSDKTVVFRMILIFDVAFVLIYNLGRTSFILFCVFRVLPEDDVNHVRQNISAYSVVAL